MTELNWGSRGQQLVSLAGLDALGDNVVARLDGSGWEQADLTLSQFDVLQHDDGIGAFRNRSAGHDLPGCAGGERSRWGFSGSRGTNKGEFAVRRSLGSPACVTIARGAGEWRLVAIGNEWLREDPARRES